MKVRRGVSQSLDLFIIIAAVLVIGGLVSADLLGLFNSNAGSATVAATAGSLSGSSVGSEIGTFSMTVQNTGTSTISCTTWTCGIAFPGTTLGYASNAGPSVVGISSGSSQIDQFYSNMIGYWALNDGSGTSTADGSGNGNNGVLVNSPTWESGSNCKFDDCLKLAKASSQKVSLNNVVSLGTAFTISAWVNPSSESSYMEIFNNNQAFMRLSDDSGKVGFPEIFVHLSDNSVEPRAEGTAAVPLNTWTLVTGTWDGTTLSIYANGQLEGQSTRSGTLTTTTVTATIGAGEQTNSNSNYFDGSIDDVRLYNYAMTQPQITTLLSFNPTGSSPTGGVWGLPFSSNLAGYWPCDENSGTTCYDMSGLGNSATFTNGPAWTAGMFGSAVDLRANSNTQYVNAYGAIYLTVGNGATYYQYPLTISAWVYPTATDSNSPIVDRTGGTSRTALWLNNGVPEFEFAAYTGGFTISGGSVPVNQWSMVTGVYDGVTATLYVNGAAVKSSAETVTSYGDNANAHWHIGESWGGTYAFVGIIDDPRVYTLAMSSSQVAALYAYNPTTPAAIYPGASFTLAPGAVVSIIFESYDLGSAGSGAYVSGTIASVQLVNWGGYSSTLKTIVS